MLEEPPAGALFSACPTDSMRVLPTVRSRCVSARARAAVGRRRCAGCVTRVSKTRSRDWPRRVARRSGIEARNDRRAPQTSNPPARGAAALLTRGAAATAADVVATVPREIRVGPRNPSVSALGMGLIGGKDRPARSILSRAEASLAAWRAGRSPKLVDWLAPLAEAQASERTSLECAAGGRTGAARLPRRDARGRQRTAEHEHANGTHST